MEPMPGGCSCGALRYRLTGDPLIVHACHCRDCQRITGGAFVINVLIESELVELDSGRPRSFRLRAGSGKGHEVFFCEACGTHLWSRYEVAPGSIRFVRAGTLDAPEAVEPDVHIYTRSKLPWLELPGRTPAFETLYETRKVWTPESLERMRANLARHPTTPARD